MNTTKKFTGLSSQNVVRRCLSLERTGAPWASARLRRLAYETFVPKNTDVGVKDVPAVCFRRFTPDGKYLVAFEQDRRNLVLYRFKPPLRTEKIQQSESFTSDVVKKPVSYKDWFQQIYSVQIATWNETLCREFCLVTSKGQHLILASSSEGDNPIQPSPPGSVPALASVPTLEAITLHLVSIPTGTVVDTWTLRDDFVELSGHRGVTLCDQTLIVLSMKKQTLHVLRIEEKMERIFEENKIGEFCQPDDKMLVVHADVQERKWQQQSQIRKRKQEGGDKPDEANKVEQSLPAENLSPPPSETGLGYGKTRTGFYSGLMQKLLAFVYGRYQAQGNERDFFHVMTRYCMLVMLTCYMLDADHVLILLGSAERALKLLDPARSTYFTLLYRMSSGTIVDVYDSRNVDVVLKVFDKFPEYFYRDSAVASTARLELSTSAAMMRRRKESQGLLPTGAQSRNVSPLLDQELFDYDDSKLPALDGRKAIRVEAPIKFRSRRLKKVSFRLAFCEHQESHKSMLFLFHPTEPFAASQLMDPDEPTIINFHH